MLEVIVTNFDCAGKVTEQNTEAVFSLCNVTLVQGNGRSGYFQLYLCPVNIELGDNALIKPLLDYIEAIFA